MEFSNLFRANMTALQETGRSADASCPPQTGFNAFAFLAFILLTIDTIMNINNNLNNNNNSNNNNDRNNNNNNMFESMNMNERRAFHKESLLPPSALKVQKMLSQGKSPWDRKVFETLRSSDKVSSGPEVMAMWLSSVVTAHPACIMVIPCLAAQEVWGQEQGGFCPDKLTCPLFTS